MITANSQTEAVESRPSANLIETRKFEFATDDDRLTGCEQVTLTVANCNSQDEAKRILRAFLAGVQRHGLTIE